MLGKVIVKCVCARKEASEANTSRVRKEESRCKAEIEVQYPCAFIKHYVQTFAAETHGRSQIRLIVAIKNNSPACVLHFILQLHITYLYFLQSNWSTV